MQNKHQVELIQTFYESQTIEAGVLYLIGTPIGNLADISLRALAVLGQVDFVLAEDTRTSNLLLQSYGIGAKFISHHKFNETERLDMILSLLEEGKSLALISDAGMPGISDPGQILLAKLHAAKKKIKLIPGPTAFASAIAASGMEGDDFRFLGFLPLKGKERQNILEEMRDAKTRFVFYEAPHRILKTLEDFLELGFAKRKIFIGRELTKTYEEMLLMGVLEALEHFKKYKPRGEFVLILGTSSREEQEKLFSSEDEELEMKIIQGLQSGQSAKEISTNIAQTSRFPKNYIKAKIQALKNTI